MHGAFILAGRVGRFELLPLSGAELGAQGLPGTLDALLLKGGYPALYDRTLASDDWVTTLAHRGSE